MRLMPAEVMPSWSAPMSEQAVRTVLVVDEEPQLLEVVRMILEREGYQVLLAQSLRQGVRIAEQHSGPIHLLLIDALIPEAQNPELLGRLMAARAGMKAILMSDAQPLGWPLPFVGFLAKPFSPDEICRAVARALGLENRQAAG